jgi:hypothetical protein
VWGICRGNNIFFSPVACYFLYMARNLSAPSHMSQKTGLFVTTSLRSSKSTEAVFGCERPRLPLRVNATLARKLVTNTEMSLHFIITLRYVRGSPVSVGIYSSETCRNTVNRSQHERVCVLLAPAEFTPLLFLMNDVSLSNRTSI